MQKKRLLILLCAIDWPKELRIDEASSATKVIELLVSRGGDLDFKNSFKHTSLQIALEIGDQVAYTVLQQAGASLDGVNEE